ncbi:hypothetical protein FGIG_12094 [Fasciola gigantica]|uniref:Uncharacterized protein n=1 Tax=Fasciola gigantica TaxID=46835 RepID=A0A504YBX8_FASGI|nr:hypothetical protein FGIG_12094 [Fasciola gigantica]
MYLHILPWTIYLRTFIYQIDQMVSYMVLNGATLTLDVLNNCIVRQGFRYYRSEWLEIRRLSEESRISRKDQIRVGVNGGDAALRYMLIRDDNEVQSTNKTLKILVCSNCLQIILPVDSPKITSLKHHSLFNLEVKCNTTYIMFTSMNYVME